MNRPLPAPLRRASRLVVSPGAAAVMLRHCRSAARAGKKAFGLLAGRMTGSVIRVHAAYPLHKDMRSTEPWRSMIDSVMRELAVPSQTPLSRRGWAADPAEVAVADRRAAAARMRLLAAYHMHRVGWPSDPLRDSPTRVDAALAAGSGLWSVIVSMVNPAEPRVRAFFESARNEEAELVLRSRKSAAPSNARARSPRAAPRRSGNSR